MTILNKVDIGMNEALLFKIAAVGILVSVLSQVLKHSGREEQAFLTSLAGLLLVLFWIIPYVYELFKAGIWNLSLSGGESAGIFTDDRSAGNDSCRTSDRTGKSAPAGRIF